jgi:isopenicillin N synthase-like dioxygenase
MHEIPLIDLSAARGGGASAEREVALRIDRACKEVGFFTLSGHGIDASVFENAYAASKRFFDAPLEHKRECRLPTGFTKALDDYTPWGYSGLLEENAYAYMGEQGQAGDYVEKFSVGREIATGEALPFGDVPAAREISAALKRYFIACEELTAYLTELFTVALDLPRDFFALRTGRSTDSLRSQMYPGHTLELDNDQGMGQHCDGTLITLLTHTSPGIQVRTRSGEWLTPRTPALDHFIVNIGDLMMRWSNDEYVSTPHRVVLAREPRQSIVFFKLANDDTVIECFPTFCRDAPAKYPPVVYKDFSLAKMNALFGR